jgi:predicted permease
MAWARRLLNLLKPERLSRDIEREVAFHLAERVDELVGGGMSEAEAKRMAARQFGNPLLQRDRTRDTDVLFWLESIVADVRYALRGLRRSRGFTLVALLSLGLGIGATTAIFSLINAVMLRPLPVTRPDRLVQLMLDNGRPSFTNPLWEQIREQQSALEGVFAYAGASFDLANGGEVREVDGNLVSGEFFSILGIAPATGRLLGQRDDVRGCAPVAVLSHGLWQREYGGDPAAVGRSISLHGHPFEIVGVVSPGFSGVEVGEAVQVYVPLCATAILEGPEVLEHRSRWFLRILGRLRPGQTVKQAGAHMASIAAGVFAATVPENWGLEDQSQYRSTRLAVRPAMHGLSGLRDEYRAALFVLLAVVGTVLLIACANVANLLLARSAGRQHEIAIRRAIGSGRGRLIRQLTTESLLLSFLGATLGMIFAPWASRVIVELLSGSGHMVWLDLSLDRRVLAFTIAVAAATGLAFGLAPALRSTNVAAQAALRSGRSRAQISGFAAGKALVIAQLALSLILIMAAGLLQGSFRRLVSLDPGFDRDQVLVVHANLHNAGYPDQALRTVEQDILERLHALQGVRSASASLVTPPGSMVWNDFVVVDGYDAPDRLSTLVYMNTVSDSYFATMGTALLAGRDFNTGDTHGSVRVAVINRTMAQRFFGNEHPLGNHFRTIRRSEPGPSFEVIGVVEDSKYETLTEAPLALAYFPLSQGELFGASISFQLRMAGPPAALAEAAVTAIAQVNPAISLQITTLADQVSASLARPRLLAALSGFFGLLALMLAVIGLYGTVSYTVTRRRGEIAMRLALGAAPAGVLRMVLREVGVLVIAGLALGVVAALSSTRLLSTFLYEVSAADPLTLVASSALLATVALAAGTVPAWKVARLDPMLALREE